MTIIQFEVGKGKTDTRVFHVELDHAPPASLEDGPVESPDFTMTMKPDEFAAVAAGERTLDVGYMQGTVKVTGNLGRMLSVLPMLTSSEFAERIASAATE